MTTAHRPTFYNAIGGENQGGNFIVAGTTKVCARDLPGQTSLKRRLPPPVPLFSEEADGPNLSRKDALKRQLEQRERLDQVNKSRAKAALHEPLEATSFNAEKSTIIVNKVSGALLPDEEGNPFPEDSDDEGPGGTEGAKKITKVSDSDDSGESDDEEEAELLREIQKIKREREAEEKRLFEEEMKLKAEQDKTRILKANPLLLIDPKLDVGLKRRWDDDVVFKNQAKDIPKAKKRFINDTVRSEFHKKFMTKYIQ